MSALLLFDQGDAFMSFNLSLFGVRITLAKQKTIEASPDQLGKVSLRLTPGDTAPRIFEDRFGRSEGSRKLESVSRYDEKPGLY